MPRQKAETKIVNAIMDFIEESNGEIVKQHGTSSSRRGEPDLFFALPVSYYGMHMYVYGFIEVKRPGEQATPLQTHRLRMWRSHGLFATVCTSVEDFQNALSGYCASVYRGREIKNVKLVVK